MTEQIISRIKQIVATGVILWIVAVVLPSYLLFYLEFGPVFIAIIVVAFIIYFIVVSDNVVLLLVFDLISICQTQAADVRKSGLLLIAFDFCDSLEF
jgi:hypothetical protein